MTSITKNKKTIIFAICYLAYTSIYIARLNLSMASPGLMENGILTKSQIGILGSVFSVIYASGRLINGRISDSKPPFFMICTGLILAGIANLTFGFFPPFVGMILLWSLNALAQSMLWSSILCVLSTIHNEAEAKKRTSLMVTSVAFGNIAGIIVSTAIISNIGLNFAFIIPGGLTLIMCAAVFLSIHKIPAPSSTTEKSDDSPVSSLSREKRREIALNLVPALLHGVMKDNISLWMTVYFVDTFGINLESSAYFVLFIPAVGFVGRMLYPILYRLCRENEHLVSVIGFAVCLISALPLCLGVGSPIFAMILLGLIYAAVSVINTSFLSIYPLHFVNEGRVATVSGIMDFVTYLGAGISSVIYGYIGYIPMFISWAVVSALSIILMLKAVRAAHNAK